MGHQAGCDVSHDETPSTTGCSIWNARVAEGVSAPLENGHSVNSHRQTRCEEHDDGLANHNAQ